MDNHNKSQLISNLKSTVIASGGGSGGHLFPLATVIHSLKENGHTVVYIGRNNPLEQEVVGSIVDRFLTITHGKLRRNWSPKIFIKNLLDLFLVLLGFMQCLIYIHRIKRQANKKQHRVVIFSSGGYVAVPVVIAGFLLNIKIVIHEQTSQAGLANRVAGVLANKICLSFKESIQFFQKRKCIITGYPIRKEFSKRNLWDDISIKKFLDGNPKKIILFSGGSNGSKLINDLVKEILPLLSKNYKVIHQTGKNYIKEFENIQNQNHNNYYPIGFISKRDWVEILYRYDLLIGRSGAGTVHECVFLNKKAIFIPLAIAQKNEQYYNAHYARDKIDIEIIKEKELTPNLLLEKIDILLSRNSDLKSKKTIPTNQERNVEKITEVILTCNHL